jgi:Chaperone of endosialidase
MKASNFIFAAIMVVTVATAISAQTSAFTYQGRFTDGGTAANGTYEMQFKLFDGVSNQIGSTVTNAAVVVSEGVFTVQLDYGSAAFSGADRFLEIGVRTAGSGNSFTILSPRQQLTSAVYAIRAGSTTTADNAMQLGGVAANQYLQTNDSRLSDARTPTAGSADYIQNGSKQQAASFNISGGGTAAGTLSATIINAASRFDLGGKRFITAGTSNNTFVGLESGLSNQALNNSFFGAYAGNGNVTGSGNSIFGTVAGLNNQQGSSNSFFGISAGFNNKAGNQNSFFGDSAGINSLTSRNSYFGAEAGFYNTTASDGAFFGYRAGMENNGANNSFFGSSAGVANTNGFGNAFFGFEAGKTNLVGSTNTMIGALADVATGNLGNATAIGYAAQVSQSNSLVLGSIKGVGIGAADTNVGIGTTAPEYRLTVKTATSNYGVTHTDGTVTVGTYVGGSTGGGWFGTKSNHSLSFFVNDGSPSMTIETGGTVKINTLGGGGITSLCRNPLNQISSCSSSLRYKTNIQPFIGGLSVLNRLRPITFDWKQGGQHDLGFGAEEIAAIEPLLVIRNDKGEVEGVKYDRITAVLVNAVKEQQEQIKQQQTEIQILKTIVCRRNRRALVCK